MPSEPKLIFYLDSEQTKPISSVNFGELDSDEHKIATVYVMNFGDKDLKKVTFSTAVKTIEILEYPTELPVGILAKVRLKWAPVDGENLLSPLIIEGKYLKRTT